VISKVDPVPLVPLPTTPSSFQVDAIEGVGQQLLVDRIDREVAEHQRRGQAGGNGNAFLHQVGPGL
jgi:hypothetical protein